MKSSKKGTYPINNRNKIESFLGLGSGILEAGPLIAGAKPEKNFKPEDLETNAHLDIGTVSFLSWIGLYIVCFVYLFQSNTEYLAWIFSLIVNVLFPITWMMDVMEYPISNYKIYMLGCVIVGFIIELVALIITLITNSKVQSNIKKNQNDKDRENTDSGENKTIYDEFNNFFSGLLAEIISFPYWFTSYWRGNKNTSTKFAKTDFYVNSRIGFFNEIIKKLFTTTAVLSIAVVANYFLDEVNIEHDRKENPHSEMGSNIHWWISLVPVKVEQFDVFWQKIIAAIGMDPFFKFFCLFCIGFCSFFFGIFIRLIPTFSTFGVKYVETQTIRDEFCRNNTDINEPKCQENGTQYMPTLFNTVDLSGNINQKFAKDIDDNKEEAVQAKFLENNGLQGYILHLKYDVVNMPKIYNNDWGPINLPGLVGFFMSMAVIIIWCFLYYIFSIRLKFSIVDLILFNGKSESYILGSYSFYLGIIGLFLITFLGCFYTLNNNVFDSNNGHSTDSVVMFLLSFFFALVGTPVVALCYEFIARLIKIFSPDMPIISELLLDNNNYKYVFYAFMALSFLSLLFGTYGAGIDKKNGNWLYNQGANKSIRAFVATIISIIFGWFTAFSSYFKMFTFLLNVISFPIRNIVFALGPITILALSITQLALAEKVKKIPGKVVGK
jgi:hypothetical protein